MSDVRIGVLLPTREMVMTGSYDLTALLDFARLAEELGFDSVWAGDSLTARPRFEPMVLLSAVAAVTEQVSVGTAVLIAGMRQPLPLAHAIATLDRASNGRLHLGIGSGSPLPESRAEFEAAGAVFEGRVDRLDQAVRTWKQSWATGEPQNPHRLVPPQRPGGPPLWLGGGAGAKTIARVARDYDGWMPYLPDPAVYGKAWTAIQEAATGTGRDPASITPALYATVNLNSDRRQAEEELDDYVRRYYGRPLAQMSEIQAFFGGSAEQCVTFLRQYVAAGARHLILRMGSLDPEPHLRRVAEAVVPALR